MPLWVLIELMSFGTISKLFSIMKTADKKSICRKGYADITYDKLEIFYHSITCLRNQCCHYQRFYRINHIIKSKVYVPSKFEMGVTKMNSTYNLVLVLFFVNPNKKLGERVIYKLKKLDAKHNVDLVSNYGFNENWKNILYKVNGYCIK